MKLIKHSRLLLLLMMVLPWFSLPLLGKDSVKRFLPAGLFITLVVKIVEIIAKERKWWWYERIHPKLAGIFPFLWGPFLIGTFWILKLTYGKFLKFITLNLIIDSAFIYLVVDRLQKLGIGSLVRIKKIQLSLIMAIESLFLYGFQITKEIIKEKLQ